MGLIDSGTQPKRAARVLHGHSKADVAAVGEAPAAALTELTQNLVECETKAVKRQFVGMNSFISEWGK